MVKCIKTQIYNCACGDLLLGSFGGKLCLCNWGGGRHQGRIDRRVQRILQAGYEKGTSDVIQKAIKQLDEYFDRKRMPRFDIPLLFAGSDFQMKVWHELMNIPYGATVSYCKVAARMGMPHAVRAVANAIATNAISIFVPCHRVVGSNNSLVGYDGGLEAKKFLLDLEGVSV